MWTGWSYSSKYTLDRIFCHFPFTVGLQCTTNSTDKAAYETQCSKRQREEFVRLSESLIELSLYQSASCRAQPPWTAGTLVIAWGLRKPHKTSRESFNLLNSYWWGFKTTHDTKRIRNELLWDMIVSHLRDEETCSSPGLIKNHFSIRRRMYIA